MSIIISLFVLAIMVAMILVSMLGIISSYSNLSR